MKLHGSDCRAPLRKVNRPRRCTSRNLWLAGLCALALIGAAILGIFYLGE